MASYRRHRPLLGTFVEVGIKPGGGRPEAVIDVAFDAIETVQRLLNFHDPDSELSRLNRAQGAEIELHPVSARVLGLACGMTRASGGLFNCTVGGALVRRGILPDHGGTPPLDHGDAGDVVMRGQWARLRRPVRVTLDGIAKGFAVDYAISKLKQQGVSGGWVNAGGDARVFGDMVLPMLRREVDRRFTGLGGLCDAAIATSSVTPRPDPDFPGVIVGGTLGAPGEGVWSVLARTAWRADALTKVASLAPAAQRTGVIDGLGGRLVAPMSGPPA